MIGRILWWIACTGIVLTYLDTLWLTIPRPGRRYVAAATRSRVILGVLEGLLAVAAVLLRRLPLLPDRLPLLESSGGLLALAGAGLAVWAKLRLGRLFTANLGVKEGHALITDGPYAIVRHPIYFGIVLFFLGTGLAWNRAAFVGLAAALLACFSIQLRIEEGIFAAHFGAAHVDYRRRVPALFPFPRPRGAMRT